MTASDCGRGGGFTAVPISEDDGGSEEEGSEEESTGRTRGCSCRQDRAPWPWPLSSSGPRAGGRTVRSVAGTDGAWTGDEEAGTIAAATSALPLASGDEDEGGWSIWCCGY